MIVLFIVKNNTDKLLVKENEAKYYYDAYYLFCSREDLNAPVKIYGRSGFRLVNFYNYNEVKNAVRDYCFLQLLSENNTKEIHYNIDDLRFWNSTDFEWVLKNAEAHH
jgi:hypothetical protein